MIIGLIKGKHKVEVVEDFVFKEIPKDKIFDFEWQKKIIESKLKNAKTIHLYVTESTTGLISIINYCGPTNKKLFLWHYNEETDEYIKQKIP